LIDFVVLNSSYGNGHCSLPDFFGQLLSLKPGKLLGIIDSPGDPLAVEDDGGCDNRAGECSSPNLIGSGDHTVAIPHKLILEPEGTSHGPNRFLR